ncbi:Myeloid leukemia factor [Aphelenchoides fujianensis]|nr:Myeloid leukemia factor [Aphelenchoides fujianensis]
MFGRDPFDPFGHMRRQPSEFDQMFGMMNQMDQMMNQMLGASFGRRHGPLMEMLEGPRGHPHAHAPPAHRRDPMGDALGLLGGFGMGGGLMGGMMDHVMHDPNSMRDKDGRFRQTQKFVNLDEEDAATFNHEFKQRANRNLGGLFGGGRAEADGRRAIEGGGHSRYGRSSRPEHAGSSSSTAAPIVTVPDDDEEEEDEVAARRARRNLAGRSADPYVRANTRSGPTIREISDEEAEQEAAKRRRGLFGQFFRPTGNE